MNCQTISQTLTTIDPNRSMQLWGLAYQDNFAYCDWDQMISRLVLLQDFDMSLKNPLFQAEVAQQALDSIFFPVCYAYSVFRIFMVCVVFVYVKGKLNDILGEMGKEHNQITIFAHENNVSLGNSAGGESQLAAMHNSHAIKRIRISSDKHKEILTYKYTIYIAIVLELICALRDFILFRGMLLFTNMMEQRQQSCFIDYYNDNFTCNGDVMIGLWKPFTYTRSDCDCLYKEPEAYFEQSSGVGNYMTTSIFIWIFSESCTIGVTTFTVLTLSRINRKEKSGWSFLKPTIMKSLLSTIFCTVFFSIVIYVLGLRIYYRFYDQGVVVFYFFWKLMGFVLVFDRLYTKIWLEWKLRFQSLHSHGIEWNEHLTGLKRKLYKKFIENVQLMKEKVSRNVQEEFEDFVDSNQYDLKKIYERQLTNYFDDAIQPYIQKAEKEASAKLKTKWYDYLNYTLLMNLIGIVGFGFLMIYGFSQSNGENNTSLFWIGFTLALVELIVFEISNVIFKLHGFFIELYKNIKLEEAQKESEESEDQQDLVEKSQIQ